MNGLFVAFLLINAVAGVFTLLGIVVAKPSRGEWVELHVALCTVVVVLAVASNVAGAIS